MPTNFAALGDKKIGDLVVCVKSGSGWVTPETRWGPRPE
jgi:hypothetical protein